MDKTRVNFYFLEGEKKEIDLWILKLLLQKEIPDGRSVKAYAVAFVRTLYVILFLILKLH